MPIRGMGDKRELDKEKLRELAFLDDLTSLYNRRYLYQYLPVELKDVKTTGKTLSLFMIDIDHFKWINDSYGHLFGDAVMLEVAQILCQDLREGDTIVRYAGDEFVAILPGADEEVAIKIAQRVVEKIGKTSFKVNEKKTTIHVTISVGLAFFPRDAENPEQLINQADKALYASKRSGRNRICTTQDISAKIMDETRLQEIFPCVKLIGRQVELNRIKDRLDEAEKGETRFVLIKGEKGIGKTRILNEVKKHAQEKGITDISVTCSPEISSHPYHILIVALESLFASLGPEAREFVRALPEAQIKQLANYIPILKQFLPEGLQAVKTPTQEEAQIDLFKGICQSLIYIVKRNTLLLVVDDFQWIDRQTVQLFNYIGKNMRNIPMLVIGAYREEELATRAEGSAIEKLLTQLKDNELSDELALVVLEKQAVSEMLGTIFTGIALEEKFINIIYEISVGNPLFIEEILRSLVDKGFIFYQEGKWQVREISEMTLPSFLKETVQKRVAEVDEETKPVISAAAVIGEVFNFDLLCRVLDKGPAYVLDVIDKAIKQHLIEPVGSLQTDKFRFNSGTIRDIIYADIGLQEKQNFHRNLALIEEEMYKDNIDYAAGSLGYHFGKAQDKEKETLYANMLLEKSKYMPTYEDIFGFLQEALMEEIEEIIVPLSDVSMKIVPSLIRSLRLAAQNVCLYPAHSAIRKSFIEQTNNYLTDILDKDSTLIIGTAENRLLLNGEEISEKAARESGAAAFVNLMVEHRIKVITFKKNLTKEHLTIFLEALSQSYDDIIFKGGLGGLLRKNDISLIRVNEVRYEQTTKIAKQRTKFEEAMLIDYLLGKVSNLQGNEFEMATQIANDPQKLAEALKKVAQRAAARKGEDLMQAQANIIAKSLQRLSDEVLSHTKGGIEQYQKNIAEALMSLDYKLRAKLSLTKGELVKLATEKSALQDAVKEKAKEPSEEDIVEMIKKEFAVSGRDLVKMRSYIRMLLTGFPHREKLLPKLKDTLAQLGLSKLETSRMLEEDIWQGLSLEDRLKQLLEFSSENYLQLAGSKQARTLVFQLLEEEQYEETCKLIEKLLKQLEDNSIELRKVTLNDLDKISEMLIVKEKYFLLDTIITSLITRLDKEKHPQIYSMLAQVLANISCSLAKKENFIQATGILREFNFRLNKDQKSLEIYKQAIREAKDKTIAAYTLLDWLVKLLETKIGGHYDFYELSKFINELGILAIGPLFGLGTSIDSYMDPFKVYSLRWGIAKVLKGMSEEAVTFLKDKLTQSNIEQVKAALEFLGHLQNKNAVRYLKPLLKANDVNVRREAIVTLGKIGGDEALTLLAETITDKSSQVRLTYIWALSNIGGPKAVSLLKPLLKDKELAAEVRRVIQRLEKTRG